MVNTEQLSILDELYKPYKITKPIRLIELFAGIGAQAKALERIGANFQHWKICEWAVPSILAYKEIHSKHLHNNTDVSKELSKADLVDYLYKKGISSNYNKPMRLEAIKRLKEEKLRQIYNAIIQTNNLVNIQHVKGRDLEIKDVDKYDYILTYSFPCQDLSLAGKLNGMKKGKNTRSGMLWEVERILNECEELPQILLMENVVQITSKKNIEDFQEWQQQLKRLGYNNYIQILNAKDYGIPQNRQRCFMISILGNYQYQFPEEIPLNYKLKDLLENKVDEKYYLTEESLKNLIQIKADDNFIRVSNATKKGYLEAHEGDSVNLERPTSTTRRGRVGIQVAQTLLTNCNQGVVVPDPIRIRKLTPKSCYRLMGFDDEDYKNAKKVLNDRMIYHTAGDSIVVNVLEAIFKQLF